MHILQITKSKRYNLGNLPTFTSRRIFTGSHSTDILNVPIPEKIVNSLLKQIDSLEKKTGHSINFPTNVKKRDIRLDTLRLATKNAIEAEFKDDIEWIRLKSLMTKLKDKKTSLDFLHLEMPKIYHSISSFPILNMLLPQAIFETVDGIKTLSTRAIGTYFLTPEMRKRGLDAFDSITDDNATGIVLPHTDSAQLKKPINFVSITMLRSNENTRTLIYPVRAILAYLTDAEKETLKQPVYQFQDNDSPNGMSKHLAILDNDDNGIRFNSAMIPPETQKQRDVCTKLCDIMNNTNPYMIVIPDGGTLFLDNQKVLHARRKIITDKDELDYSPRGGFNTHYQDLGK